ncbi:hypothetical protein M3J09_008572 [Ascochyta lentis]
MSYMELGTLLDSPFSFLPRACRRLS